MKRGTFDELTKILATSTSRRQALRRIAGLLAGGTVGGVALAALSPEVALAGGGNSDCAHFCNAVFAPGSARGQCKDDAAHGTGLCYTCGPKSAGGSQAICCPSGPPCTSYSSATCCGTEQTCSSGTCVATCTANGGTCSGNSACCSGNCSNGFCCDPGEFGLRNGTCATPCDLGTCSPSCGLGCAAEFDTYMNFCAGVPTSQPGTCFSSSQCPVGSFCVVEGEQCYTAC